MSRAARVIAVRDHPHEIDDYRAWLAKRTGPRDYLFAEERVRFEPRREDVVVPLPGLGVEGKKRAELVAGEARLSIEGLSPATARRLIEAMDGDRCLAEIGWIDRAGLAALLRGAFGRVLFAPAAIDALEATIPSFSITRFPASPYAVERSYWRNMGAVARRAADLDQAANAEAWLEALRALHVVALMGEELDSFYQPASPGADEAVHPGALFEQAVRLKRRGEEVVFLDGPRVNAKLLGGDGYARGLFASLGDEGALEPRAIEEGPSWGEVVHARSERDEAFGAWFCPPRPIVPAHVDALFEAWQQRDWASFHWRFVRLHPFRCGNQSLAMALVNAHLAPAGVPQLLCDHWALRLRREPYRELFARVSASWSVGGEGGTRLASLLERRRRFEAVVDRLGRGLEVSGPEDRRVALLVPAASGG